MSSLIAVEAPGEGVLLKQGLPDVNMMPGMPILTLRTVDLSNRTCYPLARIPWPDTSGMRSEKVVDHFCIEMHCQGSQCFVPNGPFAIRSEERLMQRTPFPVLVPRVFTEREFLGGGRHFRFRCRK